MGTIRDVPRLVVTSIVKRRNTMLKAKSASPRQQARSIPIRANQTCGEDAIVAQRLYEVLHAAL